ncbi:circadian locomoter output cycles protein kaput-like isoform X1 [Saccostrea cucullata]|uniref:circadian locomoter output cycles protein kaput-like isoform X1 n=1 Tax=Saccostrea cuccullata TaxID=36930 RepID=UPI002ECFF61D
MSVYKKIKMLSVQDNNQLIENVEQLGKQDVRVKGRKLTRAEKSRIAAQGRRDKEAEEMTSLIELLPFEKSTLQKMDKNSLLELILNYLQMKQYIEKEMATLSLKDSEPEDKEKSPVPVVKKNGTHHIVLNGVEQFKVEESQLMLEAMNGFLLLLDRKKKILYVSDGVAAHLGIDQAFLLGKKVTNLIHPSDIPELKKQFNLKPCEMHCSCQINQENSEKHVPHLDDNRVFYLRMKCVMKKNGVRTKQSGFVLMQCSGRLKMRATSSRSNSYSIDGLICICRPMQTNSIMEIKLDGSMFISRHDLGMKFTFCDPRIATLIGYDPEEVIGKTAYQFHNPLDARLVGDCHQKLIVKGTSVSKYYRFIGKNCEWVWMQTRATIIYNTSNVPQYIVCMNYIISEEEGEQFLRMQQGNILQSLDGHQAIEPTKVHKMDDHHSDIGYWSGNSPYSSHHPSPGSTDGQRAESPETMPSGNEFPTGVFQQVVNTIDSECSRPDEVMKILEEIEKEGQKHSASQVSCPKSYNQMDTDSSSNQISQYQNLVDSNSQPVRNDTLNNFQTTSESSGFCDNSAGVPIQALLNVQIAALNSSDFVQNSAVSEALPQEITDFCMQYCNSVMDQHTQQVLSELGHNNFVADFEQFNNESEVNGINRCGMNLNTAETMSGQIPVSDTGTMMKMPQTVAPSVASPQYPLQVDSHIALPSTTAAPYQYPLSTDSWIASPPSYVSHQSPMSSACSPLSSVCSPMSATSPYPCSPHVPEVASFMNPEVTTAPSNIPFTNSNLMSTPANGLMSPNSYMGQPLPSLMNTSRENSPTTQRHTRDSNMTELEKVLRGCSTNASIFTPKNSDKESQNSTLLQKMLTGQLTGESYRAMERQRKKSLNYQS